MSRDEGAPDIYEKCDFAERTDLEKQEQKKTPKGERALALLYILLAVAFVLFLTLTIVNLRRVSSGLEALEEAQMHEEINHMMAWHNLSEVQHNHDKQLSDEFKVIQGLLQRVLQEVENVWWNMTQCKTECEKMTNQFRALAAEKDELVRQQLGEVKEKQNLLSSRVDRALEEVERLSARFHCIQCPPGWQRFASSCYFFSTDRRSWMDARGFCASYNAHLVVVDTEEENTFLANLINEEKVFWLGLSDADNEGQWQWVDDHSSTFSSWNNGEPNNAGQHGEDCAIIYSNGRWNDIGCSNNEASICELTC